MVQRRVERRRAAGPRRSERLERGALEGALLLGLLVSGSLLPLALMMGVPAVLAAIWHRSSCWLVHDGHRHSHLVRCGTAFHWRAAKPVDGPVKVTLFRNLHGGRQCYILAIEWSGVGESPLCEPIGLPEAGTVREGFLEELASARSLGAAMARALGVPYREHLLSKKHLV